MIAKEANKVIEQFLKNIRVYWQIVFLVGILCYGLTLFYRLDTHTVVRTLPYLKILNIITFLIAITLAISIFHQKRKYFHLRAFRTMIEDICKKEPEFREKQVIRQFTREIGTRLKRGWLMGCAIILVGVLYYWVTYDAWDMHVYFIVGLYSLVINYPRKDLFLDVPYLVHESLKPDNSESKP
jgi:hypothetical protein